VCFGPGSIEQAHAADEWVDLDDIDAAAAVLEACARNFLAG
jgi:acetylornithine deacetylase/succinyl-diaminopimelate desuccinylase-like protein